MINSDDKKEELKLEESKRIGGNKILEKIIKMHKTFF